MPDHTPIAPDEAGPPGGLAAQILAASLHSEASGTGGGLCLAAALLASRHLRFDAADPHWPDRDRMVAGPALAGFAAALERLSGVPCPAHRPSIGCGVGFALAERMLAARFGRSLVDHRSWVFCTAELLVTGPVQEAAWLAGAWRLGRLTILAEAADDNVPGLPGFAANGWAVRRASASDETEVAASLSAALRSLKPTLIICHGRADLPAPDPRAADGWALAGRRLAGVRRGWLKRVARHAGRQDFDMALAGRPQGRWHAPLSELSALLPQNETRISTARTASHAIATLAGLMPDLAVLPGSAGSRVPATQTEPPAASNAVAGQLAAGISATLCGIALHGGLIPLVNQPAETADDSLPALRNAAEAGARLVLLLAEGTGGLRAAPYHAGLRATPNLSVFRPADAAETLECLELALRRATGPSVLLLSDSPAALLADRPARTRSARGGYVVAEAAGSRAATLIASGQELEAMLHLRARLSARAIDVAVVSLPCWDLFALQDAAWRSQVLGSAPRIGFEAGSGFGWERWLGPRGLFVPIWDELPAMEDAVTRHLGCATLA